jgi:hypothetical protein
LNYPLRYPLVGNDLIKEGLCGTGQFSTQHGAMEWNNLTGSEPEADNRSQSIDIQGTGRHRFRLRSFQISAISRSLFIAAFISILTICGLAAQQSGDPSNAMPAASASAAKPSAETAMADTKFMKEAAEGGMAEVALGQLAAEKASSSDVKKFGQRMVDDPQQGE